MRIDDLAKYGIPNEIIEIWKQQGTGYTELLPVQEEAIVQYGLFDGNSILLFSPTSSGKTFVGEVGAVNAALANKKVFYLVPQKALAEEKYLEFKSKYEPYDMKVVISTRDRREHDDDIVKLDFEVAIVVFEKMHSLVVTQPSLLSSAGLIVVDELQMMADRTRGPQLELLLTKIKLAVEDGQFIGLSAVLGNSDELAEWFGASLVEHRERPVELRRGVLHGGHYRYREHNSGTEGAEEFCDGLNPADEKQVVIQTALHLARKGEQCLIFRRTRAQSIGWARRVAEISDLPPADAALRELTDFEDSLGKRNLQELLEKGVAYHNSDLDWDLRDLVERHMRAGGVSVVVSTSTLALGLNFPVKNVFIDREKYGGPRVRWQDISQAEYENQGGRAGRLNFEGDFGRSMLVAERRVHVEGLWNRYIHGTIPPIRPSLARAELDDHVLNIVASGLASRTRDLRKILLSSFSGVKYWAEGAEREEFLEDFNEALNKCLTNGLLEDKHGELLATDLGRVCAVTGIKVDTGITLAEWARDSINDPQSSY